MKNFVSQIIGEENIKRAARLKGAIDRAFKKESYSVFIDITNGCNLRCVFCTRNNNKIVRMKTEEFELILGKVHKHISAMQLSCAWEYSIAKNAPEIVRILGKFNIPSTTLYTNGNIFADDIPEALIDARLNDFVVSIGEAKKETYERLRRGGKFQRVLTNIRKLENVKKERKSRLPRICCNLTIVNSNIDELIDFVELAHSLGIERIIGRPLILNKGLNMDNEKIRDKARVNRILDIAKKKAVGHGMSFSIPRYKDKFKPKQCRAPWNQLYISSNGDVSICPRIHRYAKIGNLLTDSFEGILKSRAMADLRRQFNERRFSNPVCSICMDNLETELAIDQGF
jgi:radical SAM protein with 4Fe4S-binding SPASM domain